MMSAISRMRPRIRIFRKLSILTWSRPLLRTPSTNRPMMVLPMPPRPPNRLVPPTTTAAIEYSRKVLDLVLLAAPKIGDAQHAGKTAEHGRDHHHRANDELYVDARIFGSVAVTARHVHIAAKTRVGENEMGNQQHQHRNDDQPA